MHGLRISYAGTGYLDSWNKYHLPLQHFGTIDPLIVIVYITQFLVTVCIEFVKFLEMFIPT